MATVPPAVRSMLSGTGDAGFAVDGSFRILHANNRLLEILGRGWGSVRGQPCSAVVRGCRLDGGPLCGPACPVARCLGTAEEVQSYDMAVAGEEGGLVWLNAGGLRAPAEWSPVAAIFLLRPVHLPQVVRGLAGGLSSGGGPPNGEGAGLSPREQRVLRLLAEGGSTEEIAAELWISSATVRNHVRGILRKLGVHSRLEAVAYGFRKGLIPTD